MEANVYEKKMITIIPNYSKGRFPADINLDSNIIKLLKQRQDDENYHAKCDLINFLYEKIINTNL